MTWRLHYYNDIPGEPLWGEVIGKWSDVEILEAVKELQWKRSDMDEDYQAKRTITLLKKFLPYPIRDAL